MTVPLPPGFSGGDPREVYDPTFDPDRPGRSEEARIGATLGLVSIILLGASFLWAHHRGPLAYTIVGTWIVSTLGALILGVRSLGPRSPGRAFALIALWCVVLSALALLSTGVALGAGYDPVGGCGGG
jgi:hypothetical protein